MECEVIGRAITPEDKAKGKAEIARLRRAATRRKRYAETREAINAKRRAKYAADPAFREHERTRKQKYDVANAERRRERRKLFRAANSAAVRKREAEARKRPEYAEMRRKIEARRKERVRTDPEYREKFLARKREWMRKWRKAKKEGSGNSHRPPSPPKQDGRDSILRTWESVANGGPQEVARYMRSATPRDAKMFLHWYGNKMNWIDSTGSRKFQPPPDADVFVPSDDFFFS